MPRELAIGDVVRMRKAHPCGGYEWEVMRLGADIGARCVKCQHRILLARTAFEKRVKMVVSQARAPNPLTPNPD